MNDSIYYYYAYSSAGDYIAGYVYADDVSMDYYVGLSGYTSSESGYWYYYIYDGVSLGYDSSYTGYNYVYAYYDSSGAYNVPYYFSLGYATGTVGIGSGWDYVDLNGDGYLSDNEYFSSYYEADYGYVSYGDSIYWYVAYNTSGDYYYGYAFADTGTYYTGQYLGASVYDNDGGYWSYYIYSSYDYGYETGLEGYDTIDPSYYYYDADTGYGSTSFTYYYNYGGIGSSYGTLNTSGEYFGYYGYYEADNYVSSGDSIYWYVAYNTSGDYYYGYAFADTGTYYTGQYLGASVYDNDGGYWSYYIYSSYDYGYETGLEGYDTIDPSYYYYDADTGYGSTSFTYYYNYGGIGSSYGTLNTSGEYFGYYGYYEADNYASYGDTIYYYYAYSSAGDIIVGYVYDDGSYGYYTGWYGYSSSESGYWTYYIADSYSVGYDTGLSGYNYAYAYYDSSGAYNLTYYAGYYGVATGYNGIGSGWDYVDLDYDGYLSSNEYFDNYYEAGLY